LVLVDPGHQRYSASSVAKSGRSGNPPVGERSISMRHRILIALTAALITLGAAVPSVAAQPGVTSPVSGTWTQLVNCAITSYNLATKQATCVGSSVWTGTWTGVTHYSFHGSLDLLAGDAQGTVDETFSGRSADGGTGTLCFHEWLTLTGATSTLYIRAALLSGTGDFTGSTGNATFTGTDNVATGFGTYAGWWQRPVHAE
jgi:hypothetical protein